MGGRGQGVIRGEKEGRASERSYGVGVADFCRSPPRRPICQATPDQPDRQHLVDYGQDSCELRAKRTFLSYILISFFLASLDLCLHSFLFLRELTENYQFKGDLTSKQLIHVEKALCLDDQFRFRYPDQS